MAGIFGKDIEGILTKVLCQIKPSLFHRAHSECMFK